MHVIIPYSYLYDRELATHAQQEREPILILSSEQSPRQPARELRVSFGPRALGRMKSSSHDRLGDRRN